ncbi:MAG: hypothetical protein IIC71_04465 [Acidobacteria bacterium]|nr:hypothetical protein [Acidobacteriota bacterium]
MAETSKTVDLALRVLHHIPDAALATATGISQDLGASRQAVLRCLRSLEYGDLVRQSETGWVLGSGILDLARRATSNVTDALRPAIVRLADIWNETALVAIPDGAFAIATDQVVASGRMVRVDYRVGSSHHMTVGAHGRAILAFHPNRLTLRLNSETEAQVEQVRIAGFAVSHDEIEPGVTGIAAPVLDHTGTAVASIGIVAPTNRLPPIAELGPAIALVASAATATPPRQKLVRR